MCSATIFKRCFYILLFTCLTKVPLANAALIGLQPGTTFADTGDSISLDLVISDLGDFTAASLGAFDISIAFDASILSFTSYALGNYLGDVGIAEAIDASEGELVGAVNVAEVSLLSVPDLDALQPGAFTLATLNFTVLDLEVGADTELSLLTGFVLADASGEKLSATTTGPATVKNLLVNVPVPGTLFLLTASLLGLLTVNRCKASLHQLKSI